jgi:hypothetical protein
MACGAVVLNNLQIGTKLNVAVTRSSRATTVLIVAAALPSASFFLV